MRNKFLKIAVVLMGVLLTHTVYGQDLQGAREGLRSYTGHLKESATGQRYDQSSDSWVPEPKGLREKQLPIFEEIKSYVTGGGSNGYLQAPTGIGKTVLFVKAIEGMLEGSSEGKVLIVVPNINLISQVRNEILSFSNFGLDQVGLYYSDISKRNRPHELTKQIVITTYKSFAETTDVFEPNDYVGLILDEVHRGTSELRESKILEFIKNTIVLGFTATPEFNEQKTVNSFLDLILKISVVDAIEKLGLLSNFRSIYYQFEGIDISEADKGRGDFDEIKLGRILDNQEVYEAAIEAYKAYKGLGGEKLGQTVVYCSGIEHAELTAKAFKGAGIEALAIHSGNDMYSGISGEERDKILKAFKAGTSKYKVLVNVNVLVEGFDAPFVRFIINLAPTMSRVIAEQRGGRGLRLIEGLKGLFGRQDKTTLILEFLYSNAKRDKNGKLKQVLYDHLIGKGVSWRKGTKAAYIKSIESEIKTRSERLRKQLSVKKIKIHDSLKAIGAVSKAYTKQEKAGLTYDASGKMMWQGMYIEDLREVAIEIGMTSYQNKGQYKRLVDKLLEGGKTAPGVSYWEKMLKSAGVTTAWFYGKVDKHGKMMWDGMYIEDLSKVAIEIGMKSYHNKGQYKRLVDKLLEGGKTAPPATYWKEMLKDAGMTSSEYYGKKGYKSVDEHGKMMWDGMPIEDLREVAIEIRMTNYHNKDQYKHLVDKLLEGGKTAPGVSYWEKMLKSAGVTTAWFYGKVDKHGKMMWQGMSIEDLKEVAIEIGMTSYRDKDQYKRLVDKLLEGGKTAPGVGYWEEMLKDAGMTSSEFYGKKGYKSVDEHGKMMWDGMSIEDLKEVAIEIGMTSYRDKGQYKRLVDKLLEGGKTAPGVSYWEEMLKGAGVTTAWFYGKKGYKSVDEHGKMMWDGMSIEDLREVAIEIGMTSYHNKDQYKHLVDKLLEGGKTAPPVRFWEKMLKSAGVTKAWFYGKVDKHGKMMWDGMYIEDLREVAIEIGMTSYQNKGQYKRLVDKLLEGGKTAPPANYWKEMLKDAGMTSSQFYGKDNSTTLGMGFADWFKAGGKLEGFVERGKGLAKQGLTKLKEVFYPEGPGGEDSKRDKSKESKEHGKKEVQAVEKADENKNKPKGSPEEFRQDKKVASGDQPIAKPKANEKGNGSETLNEGAPQKPNAADTPPVEKTLTPEQVEAQKKYEKIKLRFDNAAEEIIKSDAEALESKKMRVKIEQAYQDALKLSVKDRLDKIIAFDSYLKEQSPGSSADKKSFIKSYSGETGKFFAAIWFATFLEIATDSDQDLSYFLETLAHTPTEFLRFMTFSLGAGAGSNVAMGVEGLIAAKLSHTKGLLAYEGALFQKMKVEAGIMGAVAREQAKLMVRNQIGFMAGIMLNKILFEGYTEHFWSELMLEFGSFLGAQLTVKTGTRGAKVLYTLRRYGKVGWKTIKLGSGPGGWIMGMAELGAEIFLAKHFSQMYLHSRAKADGEGELGRNMLRFKRALKGEEDLEAYFPQKAICKQLKGFDLKHCLENVLVQNINAYMLNVIFSKLNFFVANKQLQEQQISDSFGMGHALTDAYFVRKPHIGKNPLAAPYEAAIAKHHTKLADGLKRHMQEIYKTMTPDQNKWMSWLRKQEESIEEIINAACDQDVSDLSDYNHMRRCMGAAEEGIQKMSEHMDLMVQSFGIQRSGLSRFLYRGQPTFVSRYQTIEPKRMIDLSQLLNVVLDYGRDLMLAEDITLEDKEMVSRLMNRVIEDLRTWVGAVTRPEAYQASLLKIEVGVQEPTQLLTVLIDEMAYPGLEDMFKDIKQKYAVDVVDDLLPYVDTQSGTFSIKPESEAQPEFSITIDQAGDTSWKPIVDSQHRLEGIVQKTTAVVLPEGMDVGSVEAMGMVADILVSKITHPEMGESQYTDDSGNMSREMVYERMAEQQRMDGFFKSKIISDMKNNKHVTFIFDQSIESKNTYLDAGLIIQFFSEDTSIETQDPRIQLRYRATMTVPAPVIDALNQTSKAWSNK